MFLDLIKHMLQVFLNSFKNIPRKACPSGVRTRVQKNKKEEKQTEPHFYNFFHKEF